MEILKWVSEKLDYQKTHTKVLLILLYVSVICVAIIYWMNVPRWISFLPFFSLCIFCAIIHIWIYSAKKIIKLVKEEEKLFIRSEGYGQYKGIYDIYITHLDQVKWRKKDGESTVFFLIKVVYTVMWLILLCTIGTIFVRLGITPLVGDQIEWWQVLYSCCFLFLWSISCLLNYSSYYRCLIFCYFYREISVLTYPDKNVALQYNKYLPSATSDFRKLDSDVTVSSMTFLLIIFLYTAIQGMMIFWKIRMSGGMLSEQEMLFVIIILVMLIVLGFLSLLVVTVVPKVFLGRILRNWKKISLDLFEKELYESSFSGEATQQIVSQIQTLLTDKLPLKVHGFELLVLISTFACNMATFISVLTAAVVQ